MMPYIRKEYKFRANWVQSQAERFDR